MGFAGNSSKGNRESSAKKDSQRATSLRRAGRKTRMSTPDTETAKPPEPKPKRKAKAPAIITVPAPTKKPWELSEAEVELVRNHIAKGASNEELTFCLGVARRYKLDPFRGQIWFVKRRDKSLDKYDRQTKEKVTGYRWIPIVGINGLLHIAARDHKKEFGSISKISYGPMIDVEWTEWEWVNGKPVPKGKHKLRVPEWAEVNVYKRNDPMPTVGQVFWEEIYPDVTNAPLVRQMPRLMLGKCATAQAIRKAYPATDGLYVQEEFMVEPYEPSELAKASEAKVNAIDERILAFKALSQGKLPTEEQLTRLEAGESPEQVLLGASLSSGANPKAQENPPATASPASAPPEIWPAGPKHSTER
jgi:RecT family protein